MSAGCRHQGNCALTKSESRIYEVLSGVGPGEASNATALAERAGCSPSTARRYLNSMWFKRHATRQSDGEWVALMPDADDERVAHEIGESLRAHQAQQRAFRAKVKRWADRAHRRRVPDADPLEQYAIPLVEVVTTTRRVVRTDSDETPAPAEDVSEGFHDFGLQEIDTLERALGVEDV